MIEEWRIVLGWPYEVSNSGAVRHTGHKNLAPVLLRNGYVRITLCNGAARSNRLIHRIVAEAFIGPRPLGMQINHKDGNKKNNSIDNLEYLTPSDNQKHASANGLMRKGDNHQARKNPDYIKRGEESPSAKLTLAQVVEMRAMRSRTGLSYKKIADVFDIDASNAWLICRGKSWRAA